MLDYNQAKQVYVDKFVATHGQGRAKIEAAMLAMCEFVYRKGLEDGQAMVADRDKPLQLPSNV